MKNTIPIWITLIAIALLLSACKKESIDSNSIIGKWELTNHNVISNGQLGYNFDYQKGKSFIYHFMLDKTFTLSDADSILYSGTYSVDSTKFSTHRIVRPGMETFSAFNFTISNTTLILFNNGHDMAGEYTETFIYNRISNK